MNSLRILLGTGRAYTIQRRMKAGRWDTLCEFKLTRASPTWVAAEEHSIRSEEEDKNTQEGYKKEERKTISKNLSYVCRVEISFCHKESHLIGLSSCASKPLSDEELSGAPMPIRLNYTHLKFHQCWRGWWKDVIYFYRIKLCVPSRCVVLCWCNPTFISTLIASRGRTSKSSTGRRAKKLLNTLSKLQMISIIKLSSLSASWVDF